MLELLEKYNIYNIDSQKLDIALTHSSYANEHNVESYERLEFLGDAVLETIISDYFYNNYNYDEGQMSKLRASYVCEQALSFYSKKMGIIPFIKIGNGINQINDTIAADVFESVLAVIYLSCGFNKTKDYIYKVVIPYIEDEKIFFGDYKSLLQELVQTEKKSLEYKLIDEKGPAHDKTFTIEVIVDGLIFGKGTGKSKKEAEQNAALEAIKKQAKK